MSDSESSSSASESSDASGSGSESPNIAPNRVNERPLPRGWTQYTRMDGDLYWYNESLQLTTDDDIRDSEVATDIVEIYRDELEAYRNDGFVLPGRIETNICGVADGQEIVEHVSLPLQLMFTIPNESKVTYKPKSSFWIYISMYCMHLRQIPPRMEADFLAALAFGANEWTLGHKDTNFPLHEKQCERFLEIYHDLKELQRREDGRLYIHLMVWLISEVMLVVEDRRKLNKYGTHEALTLIIKSVPPPSSLRLRILDRVLAVVLLGTHTAFRLRLQRTLANRSEHISQVRNLVNSLLLQWADSNLLATVLVLANVSLLNIVGISSIQKTASLISILFALTSIVIGLHQTWQHRMHINADLEEQWNYLGGGEVGKTTDAWLTTIACSMALPIAALLWCVLSFMVALAAFCFQNTDSRVEHAILAIILGGLGICAVGMSLFFWLGSEKEEAKHSESEDDEELDTVDALAWVKKMALKTRAISKEGGMV